MNSSSTHTPLNQKMLLIKQWHVDFCTPSNHGMNGEKPDHCAAMLLSIFDYWHDKKIEQNIKNKELNDIAEAHGDKRTQFESLLQHYKFDDLEKRILGFYSENMIRKSIQFLKDVGAISIYKNPNPKYHYDRTNFYLFNPEICNYFIINHNIKDFKIERPQNCGMHTSKLRDVELNSEISDLNSEVSDLKIEGTIVNTTSKITNLNKKEFYKKKENEEETEKEKKTENKIQKDQSFDFTETHERIASQKGVDLEAQRKMFLAYRASNPINQSLEKGFDYWLKSDKCSSKNEKSSFFNKNLNHEVKNSDDLESEFLKADHNFSKELMNLTKNPGSEMTKFREAQRILGNIEGKLKSFGYSNKKISDLKNKNDVDKKMYQTF